MTTERVDALDELAREGVVICYAPRLQGSAVWVPEAGLVVLNAERNREQLGRAVRRLLPQIRRQPRLPG
jgi:hypothetical protein